MARKSKKNKMSPVQYWEWRATVEELNSSRLEVEIAEKNAQIAVLKAVVAKFESDRISALAEKQKVKYSKVKQDYKDFLLELETKLDTTLTGKIIDPITYEIKDS